MRNSIGIELQPKYYDIALEDIEPTKLALCEETKKNEKYKS